MNGWFPLEIHADQQKTGGSSSAVVREFEKTSRLLLALRNWMADRSEKGIESRKAAAFQANASNPGGFRHPHNRQIRSNDETVLELPTFHLKLCGFGIRWFIRQLTHVRTICGKQMRRLKRTVLPEGDEPAALESRPT